MLSKGFRTKGSKPSISKTWYLENNGSNPGKKLWEIPEGHLCKGLEKEQSRQEKEEEDPKNVGSFKDRGLLEYLMWWNFKKCWLIAYNKLQAENNDT